jgi:hypothetical protein
MDEDEANPFQSNDDAFSERKKLYESLSNQDLHDLAILVNWANEESGSGGHAFFAIGPSDFVDSLDTIDRAHLNSGSWYEPEDVFEWQGDIERVWNERKVKIENNLPKGVTALVEPIGSGDTCKLPLWLSD